MGDAVMMIWVCISSVSYKIKFNGQVGRVFFPERGLRQGDPLSRYLFILAAEGLSLLLNEATNSGELSGVKIARSAPIVNHLFFADDSMIITKAEEKEAYILQNILNIYTKASGQRIKAAKSSVMFGKGVPERTKTAIATILRMPISCQASKYLGLPGEWQRSKTQALSWLKDRIWLMLQGWKECFLSQAGKEILIKSVIQSIPNYVMSIFLLPKSFCKKISSMIANFWWRQAGKDNGIHWRSWGVLNKAKREGGMGFRDLHAMNILP